MIPEVLPYNNYTGDGATTQFDFDFYIEDSSQLNVEYIDKNNITYTLEENIDYTINEVGNENGSYITFPIAGSTYSVLTSGEVISLQLTLPISQESEYGKSTEMDFKSLEYSLDYLTRLIQILSRGLERAVKVQEGTSTTSDELLEIINEEAIAAQTAAATATTKAQEASNSATEAQEQAATATEQAAEVTATYEEAMSEITSARSEAVNKVVELGSNLPRYNVFCVNTGNVDDSGEPAFLNFNDGTNSTLSSTVTLSDLADFQAVTDGSVTISINDETYDLTSLDFSAAEDYAGVAEIIQTAIQANTAGGEVWTAATVTYNETSGGFILTTGKKGAYAIGYATTAVETTTDDETEEEVTSVIGTDISSLIGWSEADNPTIITGDPYTLSTSGDFDVTTADGTIYNINKTLTYSANNIEDGTYNVFVDPVEKTIELIQNKVTAGSSFPSNASSGDFLLNVSKIPYDLQEITIVTETDEESGEETTTTTITKGLNLVLAGTLTISGGGGNLTLHEYNSNGLTLTSSANAIGEPVITLLNDLNNNEIWLEGAEVSKTTYAALYEIYGDTYGTPESTDNFILPDFRDRVIQGGDDFGYIEAGLPNITGFVRASTYNAAATYSGALYPSAKIGSYIGTASGTTGMYDGYIYMNASISNSTYGNSDTVQPPAIKVRVKTRYA